MFRIMGLANVRKPIAGGYDTLSIFVRDHADGVSLSFSTMSFPALLTEEEALFLAECLINAAKHLAADNTEKSLLTPPPPDAGDVTP